MFLISTFTPKGIVVRAAREFTIASAGDPFRIVCRR